MAGYQIHFRLQSSQQHHWGNAGSGREGETSIGLLRER